jgi:4-amino-4-deoxy-L-arabinose transferase-like glycosyltransferase
VPILLVTAVAALLRFVLLVEVPPNPYYDAAVRSMTLSWHNLFYGALEPGGSLAIDKPPLDLWFQVGSVKVVGWGQFALKLPEALAGTLAVPLLYDLVRRLRGRAAGLAAAAALAVLPAAVLTARSDTMDSVMMALLVLAAWLVVRAMQDSSVRLLLIAAVVLGVAFNVKLAEALIPVPALAIGYLIGAPQPLRRRLMALLAAGAILAIVALSWATAATLAPGRHPYRVGSATGSVYNTIVGFNGVERVSKGPPPGDPAAPAPLRLLAGSGTGLGARIGTELVPALLLGALALLLAAPWRLRRHRLDDAERATAGGIAAIAIWLLTGTVLFSAIWPLHLRYLEGFTPAIAAALGLAVADLARRALGAIAPANRLAPAVATALALAACLAFPAAESIAVVRGHLTDSALAIEPAVQVQRLAAFLALHSPHTRYEIATYEPLRVSQLVIRDARPVLSLTSWEGRPFTSIDSLRRTIALGQVRYAILDDRHCPAVGSSPGKRSCSATGLWVRAHGRDVTQAAGLAPPRRLYELPGAP